MGLVFEWDSIKAQTNFSKHIVSFEEASTIFSDARSLTIDDPLHSVHEKRYITMGISIGYRLLVVVHTERNGKIRIISAREASKKEKNKYYEKDK